MRSRRDFCATYKVLSSIQNVQNEVYKHMICADRLKVLIGVQQTKEISMLSELETAE